MAQLLTSKEAARALGVDRATVHRWVAAERLTPQAVLPAGGGKAYFFDPEEIAELAARRQPRERAS